VTVTRFSAAGAIAVCWLFFIAIPARGEGCLGGSLNAAGTCVCDAHVVMSGETYALEWLDGKCVPKRCPVNTYLRGEKCVASNDTRFAFSCRTGYIPATLSPGNATTGLHCVPDPSFCPPKEERKEDGSCLKTQAIAIDCFEDRCVCGDPHAEWVGYLCQCSQSYESIGGRCVVRTASPRARGDEDEKSDDSAPRRCANGAIRSRHGCGSPQRRYHGGGYADRFYYYRRWRYGF
jgi:hypothetical protein